MKSLGLMCMLAAVGCSAPQQDGAWTDASAALQSRGVYAFRVEPTNDPSLQLVSLRDAQAESIGHVQLQQSNDTKTVSLLLKDTTWQQVMGSDGQMTLTFDGQSATLQWDGSAWVGSAAGQDLLAQSQPFITLVGLVGGEAKLLMSEAPASSPAPSPQPPPAQKADGGATPPTLVCSDVVVTGSGWAWYWEDQPQALACRRATDVVNAECETASDVACCNAPKACVACVNWGTGWACSQAGYVQAAAY